MFTSSNEACAFVLSWDGKSSFDLLQAIKQTREEGSRIQSEQILRRIARLPFDFPRPTDIPIFFGIPVWAIDADDYALIGMPGSENVVHVSELRKHLARAIFDPNISFDSGSNASHP